MAVPVGLGVFMIAPNRLVGVGLGEAIVTLLLTPIVPVGVGSPIPIILKIFSIKLLPLAGVGVGVGVF